MNVRYRLAHIWHLPEGTKPYRVEWCDACRYGALEPRPTPDELRTFYDPNYFTRYAGEAAERCQGLGDREPEPATLLDRVRDHLAWRADRGQPVDAPLIHARVRKIPARICDIGCGNGELLAGLRDLGHRVVGVEVDDRAVQRACARGLEVHSGTAEELPLQVEAGGFDAVAMIHVLEHCVDPLRALRNTAELLAPGGLLFVEVPNNEAIVARRSGTCWFFFDAGRHVNFFSPDSLAALARRVGLVPVDRVFSSYAALFLNDRAAAEGAVYDVQYARPGASQPHGMRRNTRRRQWGMLALSLFAMPHRKYEVVGLVARREGEA
jgi:SAM-dependent methyltransferase